MATNARNTEEWTDSETEAYYMDKLPKWAREYIQEAPIPCSAETIYGFIEDHYGDTIAEMKRELDEDIMYFMNMPENRGNFPIVRSPKVWTPLVPVKKDIIKKYFG